MSTGLVFGMGSVKPGDTIWLSVFTKIIRASAASRCLNIVDPRPRTITVHMGFVKSVMIADLKPHPGQVYVVSLFFIPIGCVYLGGYLKNTVHDELLQRKDRGVFSIRGKIIGAGVDRARLARMRVSILLKKFNQLWIHLLILAVHAAQDGDGPELSEFIVRFIGHVAGVILRVIVALRVDYCILKPVIFRTEIGLKGKFVPSEIRNTALRQCRTTCRFRNNCWLTWY